MCFTINVLMSQCLGQWTDIYWVLAYSFKFYTHLGFREPCTQGNIAQGLIISYYYSNSKHGKPQVAGLGTWKQS